MICSLALALTLMSAPTSVVRAVRIPAIVITAIAPS
jgi:hypothetical protein